MGAGVGVVGVAGIIPSGMNGPDGLGVGMVVGIVGVVGTVTAVVFAVVFVGGAVVFMAAGTTTLVAAGEAMLLVTGRKHEVYDFVGAKHANEIRLTLKVKWQRRRKPGTFPADRNPKLRFRWGRFPSDCPSCTST